MKRLGIVLGMELNIFQRLATKKTHTKEMHRIPIPKNGKKHWNSTSVLVTQNGDMSSKKKL